MGSMVSSMGSMGSSRHLKLCALPARVAEVLRMTHLTPLFGNSGTQAEAIAACHQAAPSSQSSVTVKTDVLCVDGSPDALAYAREVLKRAGFGVLTATNIADAVVLATTTRPKIVIISAALRSITGAQAFTSSSGGVRRTTVIELPHDFSKDEAGHAARDLLERVQSAMAAIG
jgi:PleD family two-component response regulator